MAAPSSSPAARAFQARSAQSSVLIKAIGARRLSRCGGVIVGLLRLVVCAEHAISVKPNCPKKQPLPTSQAGLGKQWGNDPLGREVVARQLASGAAMAPIIAGDRLNRGDRLILAGIVEQAMPDRAVRREPGAHRHDPLAGGQVADRTIAEAALIWPDV